MPLYPHADWGDIQKYIFAKGVITSVDSENDTVGVTVEGCQDGSDVPLFYHCSDDAEERSNGAIEGGAAAFSAGSEDDPEDGDEVMVMCEADTGLPVRVIGFVDGIKTCCSRLIFKAGNHYAVWGIGSGIVLLEPTDDPDEYAGFVPDPFTGNERCITESFYNDRYVPCFLNYETTFETIWTAVSIDCPSGSFVDEPVIASSGNVGVADCTNEFGGGHADKFVGTTWSYAPFCDDGGNPNAGGTSSDSYSESWNKKYGYVFEYVNKTTDENKQTAIITETGTNDGVTEVKTYSIVDPTGGGSCEGALDYTINEDGFYPVNSDGDPVSGNVVTWIISKINGTYAAYATNDPGLTLNGQDEYELTDNVDLADMLAALCNSAGAPPVAIFA